MLFGQHAQSAAAATGVRTIATGNLHDQVLSADGQSVLVSDSAGTVTRYDLATGAPTGSWQVGSNLGGMAVSPDGHYLWATELTPGAVIATGYPQTNLGEFDRLDLQSGAVTRFDVPVSAYYDTLAFRDVAVESDGKLLLTVDSTAGYGSNAIYEFNPNGDTSTVTELGGYYGLYSGVLQGTADGNHIAIADAGYNDSLIYLRTVSSGTTVSGAGIHGENGNGGAIAISVDGSLVAHAGYEYNPGDYSHAINTVVVLNSALQVQTDLAKVAPQALGALPVSGLAFSGDGAHLFVLNSSLDAVVKLSTSDWSTEAVIPVDKVPGGRVPGSAPGTGGDLSSFGDRLLASTDGHWLTVQTDGEVQVIDLTQTTPTPVLTTLTLPTAITVGPDGGNLFITAGATDDSAAVQSVTVTLDHALATVNGPVTQITFSADHDAYDDGYSAVNLALTGAAAGTYSVTAATVTDAAGHSVSYDANMLAGLLPATSFTITSEIDLTAGANTYHDTYGQGLIVHGLDGNDTLYGSSSQDTLDGGAGDDTLVQGLGATNFIGGDGVDTVVLNGNARDYYEAHDQIDGSIVLLARNGSATETISPDVEHVRFLDGSLLSDENQPDGDYSGAITGDYQIHAPASGDYSFDGGSGQNDVYLPGDVADYALSRGVYENRNGFVFLGEPGNFNLSAKDGSAVYSFEESVDTIHFANGQYLSLKDLPAYVGGDASLPYGSYQDDILYQTKASGYEAFYGGAGHDDLYLGGNVSDYTLKPVFGEIESGFGHLSGVELESNNGSGGLFIDRTVDTIHFQNGQYLAFNDLPAYINSTASTDAVYHILADGENVNDGSVYVTGDDYTDDVLLLDGNADSYSVGRDIGGNFVIYPNASGGHSLGISVSEDVETVQFGNGQYLALKDLGAYLGGSDVFTAGSNGDDLLFVAKSGDQYVFGGAGNDDLYLNGNTHDYSIQDVQVPAGSELVNGSYQYHPAINGVELIADNGSGNIFIDQSVETVHFQNGQYLAFNDLHAYIG